DLGNAKSTTQVRIENVGGNIVVPSATIFANAMVRLAASNGSISNGSGGPLKISAPIFSANASGSTGLVNINNVSTLATTLLNSGSSGNFTVATAGSLTITNVLAGAPGSTSSIALTSAGTLLQTNPNSVIGINAQFGTLHIEDTNASGSIVIGAGTNI